MLSLLDALTLALATALVAHAKFVDIDVFQVTPFWGTYMDFGDAKNVSMLIDSGSAYTSIFDPTIYKPSPNATSFNQTHPEKLLLNRTHWLGYGQVKENGCGGLYYWCDVYTDTLTWQGLTTKHQRFCAADYTNLHFNNQVAQIPPFQGLAGFTTNNEVQLGVGGRTLISNLYAQGQIDELRFGTALGTAGTGTMVLGGVDHSLFEGDLVYQPIVGGEWMTSNISITINGSVVLKDQAMWLDTGGPAITASFKQVRAVFEAAGVEAVETETGCGKELFGYYPCDNPPQIGLNIAGTNFDILPSALRMKDNGANNCTAIIVGQPDANLYTFWIVGQAFLQGKYVDHYGRNATRYSEQGSTLGFATLKNPADPKSARLTNAAR